MKKAITIAITFAAAALFAAEANLYHNPEFNSKKLSNGKTIISEHRSDAILSCDGTKYNGHNTLKLSITKKPWAYTGVVIQSHSLPPGKYTFSVWCKTDKNGASLDKMLIISRYFVKGKMVNEQKEYKGANKPASGKWTELVYTFTVKPGCDKDRSSILYGHSGSKFVEVWYADPRIVKFEEE